MGELGHSRVAPDTDAAAGPPAATTGPDGESASLAGDYLAAPLVVGGVQLPNRVVLAPMAGVTTSAFRRRAKTYGVGLTVTEMVSAYGLVYGDRRTAAYLRFWPEERPLAVQVFADRPEVMAAGVEAVLAAAPRADLIDINMGCPVRKVMKTGAGAALLADPTLAAAVAAAAVAAAAPVGVPVTVKIRSGLTPDRITAVEVARRLEEVGVAGIGVHPRAASEFYRGKADHRVTAAVVAAVSVPVLASGDIDNVAAAGRVVADTGAAAVMVARGALGRPWLVGHLLAGVERPPPPLKAVVAEVLALLDAAVEEMGEYRAVRWIRKLLSWYLRPAGVPGPSVAGLMKLQTRADLCSALLSLVG